MITSETKLSNTIDWYSFTCDVPKYPKNATVKCVELEHGLYGYSAGVEFLDGRIELVNPSRPDMRIHIQYTGSALLSCQNDYDISPLSIVCIVAPNERVSRVDLAIDIRDGSLDIPALAKMVKEKTAVSLATKSMFISSLDAPGATLYIGAPKAKQRLRIYDKAAEQGLDNEEWTRIELQLRGKRVCCIKDQNQQYQYNFFHNPPVKQLFIFWQ